MPEAFDNDPPTTPITIPPMPPGYPTAPPPGFPPAQQPSAPPGYRPAPPPGFAPPGAGQPGYPQAYPMPPAPPAPKQRPTGLLAGIGAGVVVLAAVLVTGLAWPGWMTGTKPQNTAAQHTSTQSPTTHNAATQTDACQLVPTSEFEQVVGASQLTPKEQTPIHDPVTGTPGYLCLYSDPSGTVLADIEVADYPASVDAQQLFQGVASTGTDVQPVKGLGDVAGTVSDLGQSDNTALIVIRGSSNSQHLIVVAMSAQADPSAAKLTQLARTALNAG